MSSGPLIYISGAFPRRTQEMQARDTRARLLSCHSAYMQVARRFVGVAATIPEWKQRPIMLDSGAFSAWKTGRETTLDEVSQSYNELSILAQNVCSQVFLINLDVIPGSPGVTADPDEIKRAIAQSDINFDKLKQRFGDRVLPVFHQGEDFDRLKIVCAQSSYVGISPRNDVPEGRRVIWAQEVHARIREIAPHVKTHGLAATGNKQFSNVPWYSVDSASWTMCAAYGSIMVWVNGRPLVIGLTDRSPRKGQWDMHWGNCNSTVQSIVKDEIDKSPFTFEVLCEDFCSRATFNIPSFYKMQDYAERDDKVLQTSLF